jgi:hypothetical protein
MPYIISKQGNKWVLKRKESGEVVSHHESYENAVASMRIRNASHHGFKPTKK